MVPRQLRYGIAAAVALCGWLTWPTNLPPAGDGRVGGGDLALFVSIVSRLQTGEDYYAAVGTAMREYGFATRPVVTWRTPLYLNGVAALTTPGAWLLLMALAAIAIATITRAYSRRSGRWAQAAALLMLGAMLPMGAGSLVLFAEAWCAVFIALSLSAYLHRRHVLAALLGLLALFVRELAVPYVTICGVLALRSRRQVETAVWVVGAFAYGTYYAIHAMHAMAAVLPNDLTVPDSWVQWQGLSFLYRTAQWYGWARIAPGLLAPLVVAGGAAGLMSSSLIPQARLALIVYALLFTITGKSFNTYWGLMTAPLWALALLHSAERTPQREESGRRASSPGPLSVRSSLADTGA